MERSIAQPLVDDALLEKLQRLIKSLFQKGKVKRGAREVTRAVLKQKEQGILLIAADTRPVDVIAHLAVLCEDRQIPYAYVPTKRALNDAGIHGQPTTAVLILEPELQDGSALSKYKKCLCKVKALQAFD